MGNPHGKPPVPNKALNPLTGMNISKIDFYGLGEIVRKLRNAGLGYIDIANELNTKYIGKDAPKISTMAVQRWCTNPNNHVDEIDLRKSEDTTVNVYRELCEALDITNEQIDILRLCMDTCNKKIKSGDDVFKYLKYIKEISSELDKYLARRQQLSTSIAVMQEKVYSFIAANEIVTRVLDKIKKVDLSLYADIKEDIANDPILIEAFKRIQPNK